MDKYSLAVDVIKSNVSAIDIANALGWEIRHGRCRCPVHNGDGFNCRLYPGDRGYVCWVCKSGGDVIRLVQESIMKGSSFRSILVWFSDTFNLSLDLDGRIDEEQRRQAEMAKRMRKEATEQKELKDRMSFGVMLMADRIVERLEDIRDANAPKTPNERWNDAFCNAIRSLPGARGFVDDCMMDCLKEGK